MSRPLIGRTARRLRLEMGLTQQALAARLGISASYLNLIEHDQRAVTATVLIKLTEALGVDLAALSGHAERQLEAGLREVLSDPMLGLEVMPENEVQAIAASAPNAARGVLALYRAWRVAREDASGIALPSGRRLLLPNEEVRDFFHERGNHFARIETFTESLGAELQASPAEMNHAIAQRLRQKHNVTVTVTAMPEADRRYDPRTRELWLAESLPRESRGFRMAFQLMLLEARDAVDATLADTKPSTSEAEQLIRIGLLNYAAAALLMPYAPFLRAARELRHDVERLAARFGTSYEQVAQRLSTLQREGARGLPFFFLRADTAGNVTKRFSAAGFPFARFGGSCPKWIVHHAFATPGVTRVQAAELPDGAAFLCIARAMHGTSPRWGEPPPTHVVAIGCDITRTEEVVYADGLDLVTARVGIGLSCRLCDRADCRSRAFPPLEHRLRLDANEDSASPWRFDRKDAPR
ncbi:helix-turn-helix domain-containing protein [Roseococcus microcysteis]|uniref:helix-turn-helix domain-containing protein n=1 Tax=Roseococcus microcysteis TaxID=2771361 RepID=UPI00168ADA91|nr:short-chain fatty acyl-CoA regulator family protein [Roseococcus microcysteis]